MRSHMKVQVTDTLSVETWCADAPWDDTLMVRVVLNGMKYRRAVDWRDEKQARDLRVASDYAAHAHMLTERLPASGMRQRAIVTDWCLAIERLFPDLRDALPVAARGCGNGVSFP
jgi:hypothetical protein